MIDRKFKKISKGNHKNWRLVVRNLPFDVSFLFK